MVTIIGAGMAGVACAHLLREHGVDVRIIDRGRAPGGRLASPELHGRRVDLGAGYFTAKDDAFVAQVGRWLDAGLAHEWTDTFDVVGGDPTTGPMRYGTPEGNRSLVRDLLRGMEVERDELDEVPDGPVVLAMPDPQAARLIDVPDAIGFDPVIAVACGYGARTWSLRHAAFVNEHPALTFIADDGDRRGDGAPVLVAHTTHDLAAQHLDAPDAVAHAVAAALSDLLGTGEPEWTHTHRWSFAKPAGQHDAPFGRVGDDVWLCGDQWCPEGAPRVESAWLSGTRVAAALASS